MCLNLENSRDDLHWFTSYEKHLFPCSKNRICIIVIQNSHAMDSRLPELLGTPGSSAVVDSRSWLFSLQRHIMVTSMEVIFYLVCAEHLEDIFHSALKMVDANS